MLTGCDNINDQPLIKANELMLQFKCETRNGRWAALMDDDMDVAEKFIAQHKNGIDTSTWPIDQVVKNQLEQFKGDCKASNEDNSTHG